MLAWKHLIHAHSGWIDLPKAVEEYAHRYVVVSVADGQSDH